MAGQGRRPITDMQRTRQAIWALIRQHKRFTASDLCRDRGQLDGVNNYLRALVKAGYLKRIREPKQPGEQYRSAVYELVRDCGIEAPRVGRNGQPMTQGRAREQLWRSMRILRDFNAIDLMCAANTEETPVTESHAKRYLTRLHTAGYLQCTRPSGPGRLARYRLIPRRNTGPEAPAVQRSGDVFDSNLQRVVYIRQDRRDVW